MELFKKKQDLSKYDDYELAFMDLEVILTQKCNLSCAHCMRGDCMGKEISEEVLDALFQKVIYVDNLALGGGEITFAPDKIRLLTEKLKEYGTIVHHVNFTSNGTNASPEAIEALKELYDYVESCDNQPHLFKPSPKEKNVPMFVCFSFDDYHINQILEKGFTIEQIFANIATFHKVFGKQAIECRMECDMDVYDEGRAKNLPASAHKVPMQKVLKEPYPFVDLEPRKIILIGNIPCISCDGNVIPTNIAFASEEALSFGNVVTDSTSQILSTMNSFKTDARGYNNARVKLYKAMTAPKHLQKQYKPMLVEKLHIFQSNLEYMLEKMQ